MQEKKLKVKEATIETAYHEASHYVIGVLVSKNYPEFLMPYIIDFYFQENQPLSDGKPFLCQVGTLTSFKVTNDEIYEFYREDRKRAFLECYTRLAGFCSYPVFINKEEELYIFDSIHIEENEPLNSIVDVSYHSFDEIWYDFNQGRLESKHAQHDISATSYTLTFLKMSRDEKDNVINSMINDLKDILSNEQIMQAVELVKDYLIKHNGSTLEGKLLEEIQNQVIELVNGFDLEPYLAKYELPKSSEAE